MCCAVLSCLVMSDSLRPHGLTLTLRAPLSMGILQARILKWVVMLSARGISPTLGWNLGLLHFGQILYGLSYQGSPRILE